MAVDSLREFPAAREDPNELKNTFPALNEKRMPMGDVFTSCNWVFRDGSESCLLAEL
jgi:ATP-dependent DNA helicase 2 subunit 1